MGFLRLEGEIWEAMLVISAYMYAKAWGRLIYSLGDVMPVDSFGIFSPCH